jgi:hypothetical protein
VVGGDYWLSCGFRCVARDALFPDGAHFGAGGSLDIIPAISFSPSSDSAQAFLSPSLLLGPFCTLLKVDPFSFVVARQEIHESPVNYTRDMKPQITPWTKACRHLEPPKTEDLP